MTYNAKMIAIISDIAKKFLHLETLETRNSDRLDFQDQSVWGIKRALEAAFQRGYDVAVEETIAVTGWQPIETAPALDGKVIAILFTDGKKVFTGHRVNSSSNICSFSDKESDINATHWMPFPDVP